MKRHECVATRVHVQHEPTLHFYQFQNRNKYELEDRRFGIRFSGSKLE